MKRFILFTFTSLLLVFVCAGCKQAENPVNVETSDKISVVATIFAPYDFAREISGDKADVTMLLPPASESHSFEPTPQDIIKIQNCDVFIYVGGESDKWVDDILSSMDTEKMKIVTLMDCVEVVEEEIVEGIKPSAIGYVYTICTMIFLLVFLLEMQKRRKLLYNIITLLN